MSGDFEELITRATTRRPGLTCWVGHLEGEPARYVKRLEEIEAAAPELQPVNRAEVRRTLASEWGIEASAEAVKRHFRGECKCADS